MRGKWDMARPIVQSLCQLQQLQQQQPPPQPPPQQPSQPPPQQPPQQQQQQQQQQQTIDEERRQPLYLATTTPAWDIADRNMKEEAMEEKNNDSGVSPDHYTSSNANSSFSPSSITSQDSTTMQNNTFDYSPQSVSKNYAPLPEQPMDVVSSTAKSCSEDLLLEEYIMKCPICAVVTTNRLQFSEHLPIHCMEKRDGSEFIREVLEQLMNSETQQPSTSSSPTQDKRPEQEHEEADALPRVMSQGKVKVHRCKYCNHVALTKTKFWEHKRIHIRKEKMLTCPKCPFVTEYKHHLEYHLRNHFGSKPFKCDQCNYACVNMSMLNSHLKSHSNIHPYRCADCSYAAKYCHTLKLHLRKSKHQPGMVLNADGSPNPLHIIDVYGTRRGPKQKPTKPKQEFAQNCTVTSNANWQGVSTSPVSSPMLDNLPNTSMNGISGIMNAINTTNNGMNPINGMGAINEINAINSMNSMNGIGGLNVINSLGGMNGINAIAGMNGIKPIAGMNGIKPIPGLNVIKAIGGLNGINPIGGLNGVVPNRQISYQYNKLYSQFPPVVQFPTSAENQLGQLKTAALMDYARSAGNEELPQNLVIKCKEASTANGMLYSPSEQTEVLNLAVKTVPLDLSKSSINSRAQNKPAPALAVRATGTSRRKGKAVKLDRRMMEEDTDEEQQLRSPQLMQIAQQIQQGPSNSEASSSSAPRPGDPSFSGSSSNGAGFSGASASAPSASVPSSSGASFSVPSSTGASFSVPSSTGASFSVPSSSGASFSDAGFSGASFSDAGFSGAGFSGAGFSGAGFSGAGFGGAGFSGASFSGASFSGASFSGASFSGPSSSGSSSSDPSSSGPSSSGPSSSGPSSSGPSSGGPSSSGPSSSGPSSSGPSSSGPSSSDPSCSGPSCSGPSSSGPSSSGPSCSDATENDDSDPEDPNDYHCKYCEIGFANIVMYTAHMEYHGASDPHICKMCGLKCPEKVSFFLHIARSKHT